MTTWSVRGVGTEVTVVSPEGDVYPFVITSPRRLDLALGGSPTWRAGTAPRDADLRIVAAHGAASRWASETFGAPLA